MTQATLNEQISDYFKEILQDGELFFPFSQWPPIAKEYMCKKHKTRNERYYLTRFLTYNGLRPEIATHWIMREGSYDDEAKRDQAGLTTKAKTVEFFRKGRIFNMRLGRTDTADDVPISAGTAPPPSAPQSKAPQASVTFEKLFEFLPPPKRTEFDDEFDYKLATLTWKAETRKWLNKWKDEGLRMEF